MYWVLYIDLFFVSFDGNLFDVVWVVVLVVLKDMKFFMVRWDFDREMVVCWKG